MEPSRVARLDPHAVTHPDGRAPNTLGGVLGYVRFNTPGGVAGPTVALTVSAQVAD
jgi:hypothetical protein